MGPGTLLLYSIIMVLTYPAYVLVAGTIMLVFGRPRDEVGKWAQRKFTKQGIDGLLDKLIALVRPGSASASVPPAIPPIADRRSVDPPSASDSS